MTLVKLSFQPNTLTSLPIDGTDNVLLAAGGQEAEVHLSYCSPSSARHRQGVVWQTECTLTGSINNSVLLTSMSLTRSYESSVEPRIGISNNDETVKFYNVPLRAAPKRGLEEVGSLRLHVPVNHCVYSPPLTSRLFILTLTCQRQYLLTAGPFYPSETLPMSSFTK